MLSRKQPRDRVKNKARQGREQKSAAGSNTTIRNKQLCAARDSEKAPKHKSLPRSCSTSTCCERFREGPKHKRIPRSCSTSTCCERFREHPKTQGFTPILFNIYVLRDFWRRPQNTSVYSDLVQDLCAARDLRPESISVYPDLLQYLRAARVVKKGLRAQAFTPILFNIYVLREIWRRPHNTSVYPDLVQHLCAARERRLQNTGVYPDLVQHLCAARDSEKAPKHKRLPRSCSTSMCCEIFGRGLKA